MLAAIAFVAGIMIIFGIGLTAEVIKYVIAGYLILWAGKTVYDKNLKGKIGKKKEPEA